MNEPIKFQVLPDEHIAEEDTVSADELFNDIMAGFAELQAFEEGNTVNFSKQQADKEGKTLRVTEYVDGKRLPPSDITAAELKARRVARETNAKSAQHGSSRETTKETLNENVTVG